jgi:AcrR family transcriptional regulator
MSKRAEIIEKVIPLMSNTPFDELSIASICEAAGISSGTFYHYFSKKTDILVGLLGLIDDYMINEVFPILTSEDEIENLKAFAHGWSVYVSTHGIDRSKLITNAEPSDRYVSGQKRIVITKLVEIFRSGQEKNQISRVYDAEMLAHFFLLALRGVTTDWSRHGGKYSVVDMMDIYISFFVRALKD